jgi:(p)ppGpp synthase/HD superfamily hydrolase
MLEKVKEYAIKCCKDTNHLYDDQCYSTHLKMVAEYAEKFSYLLSKDMVENVLYAAWCHDLIEDDRQTYSDVKKNTNIDVAEIVYALTNEKGKNRKERANDKYYIGIMKTTGAQYLKICDRLANISYSLRKDGRMLNLYRKENKDFKSKLYSEKYDDMFKEIENLLIT